MNGKIGKLLGLIVVWPLIFTVGTITDLINVAYEPNIKNVYSDNILTVPAPFSQKGFGCHHQQITQNANNNNKVVATITGEDAIKILNTLEDGNCINFKVVQIPDKEEGGELVIELIKVDKNTKISIA